MLTEAIISFRSVSADPLSAARKEDFELAVFVLLFGYYVSFIGYILFPAIGPRYTLAHLQTVPLEGSVVTDFVRDILNSMEHNKRDCMPSGHTQVALMVLFLSYRYRRLLFYLLLPIVTGLILSTVYHRYHYVIDLFVGASLAVACMIVAPRFYKGWNSHTQVLKNGHRWFQLIIRGEASGNTPTFKISRS